ncbi:MAG: cytochrome c [Caldilineaceae bacterium]
MKKVLLIVVLLLTVVLTACGGEEEPTATPAPVATAAPADTSDDAAADPPATPTAAEVAVAAGDAEKGKQLFMTTCSACHGPTGEGVQGLGKDMTHSEFIAGLSDEELLAFIKKGRPIGDPLNTTGVDMPPKGGNPALTDEQLIDIIAFIRSIHQE